MQSVAAQQCSVVVDGHPEERLLKQQVEHNSRMAVAAGDEKQVVAVVDSAQQKMRARPEVKVFRRRWIVLTSFSLLSLMNAFQFIQYSIVSDSVTKYYDVSTQTVNWTTMVFMVVYIPFVSAASWMLDNKGLRKTVLLAGVLNCLASWVKAASGQPELFAVAMAGQTVAALAQVFILATPARLAAVWFGAGEVATACAIGVFGNQVGNAVGFVVPPLIVKSKDNMDALGEELRFVNYGVAAASTLSLLLIAVVFQDAPPVAPSFAQAQVIGLAADRRQNDASSATLVQSIHRILRTPGYLLLLVTYGISVGVFYAISTLLNQLVLSVFPTSQDAGNIGLVIMVSGLLGTVLCGMLLDATHKYKEVTLAAYFLSLVGMVSFAASFFSSGIWVVYASSFLLGFFLTGYFPLAFELGVELTYPEPEGTAAGLLNGAAQIFGIIFTEICGALLDGDVGGASYTHLWVNGSLSAVLLLGTLLTAAVPSNLQRQAAEKGWSTSQQVEGRKASGIDDNSSLAV